MPSNKFIFLQEWAYIMIILVCFAILLTLFSYCLCNLISRRQHKQQERQFDLIDEKRKNTCSFAFDSNGDASSNTKTELVPQVEKDANKCGMMSQTESSKLCDTEKRSGYFFSLLTALGNLIAPSQSATSNQMPSLENLNDPSSLITVKRVISNQSSSSSSSSDDSDKEMDNQSVQKQAPVKSSVSNETENKIRRKNSLVISKPRSIMRNPSLQTTANTRRLKLDSFKESSTESSGLDRQKKSISLSEKLRKSSQDSQSISTRKSSLESSYYQSSVANLYRKKRASDASSATNESSILNLKNNRKLSINQSNPFIEPGVKLVSFEYQSSNDSLQSLQHIALPLNKSFMKQSGEKLSCSSSTGSANTQHESKVYPFRPRHYSVFTPNCHDKFWVPPDIALTAQLDKQRCSLPGDITSLTTEARTKFENQENKIEISKFFL